MNQVKQYVAKKKNVPMYLANNNNVCVGFPGGSVVKNPPANVGDAGSIPDSGISPGKNGNPLQVFLPGKSHGQRSLAGYKSMGLPKSGTRLKD